MARPRPATQTRPAIHASPARGQAITEISKDLQLLGDNTAGLVSSQHSAAPEHDALALALAVGDAIGIEHLPAGIADAVCAGLPPSRLSSLGFNKARATLAAPEPERGALLRALREPTLAACGQGHFSVYRRMERHGIVPANPAGQKEAAPSAFRPQPRRRARPDARSGAPGCSPARRARPCPRSRGAASIATDERARLVGQHLLIGAGLDPKAAGVARRLAGRQGVVGADAPCRRRRRSYVARGRVRRSPSSSLGSSPGPSLARTHRLAGTRAGAHTGAPATCTAAAQARAIDVFSALFARSISESDLALLSMATRESVAYLSYLVHRGEFNERTTPTASPGMRFVEAFQAPSPRRTS